MSDDRPWDTTLTSGPRLAKNIVWNLAGQGLPLLVGIVVIPVLINALGTERFGILAIAWMIIGYFSLIDLGTGRALTILVAKNLGTGDLEEIPRLIWTALALVAGLGIAATILVLLLTQWIVGDLLNIPALLQEETAKSFYILAVSIPLVITTAGLRGVMEAYQRFGLVNAIRLPVNLFTFLGPLAVLPFSKSVYSVVAVLATGRLVAFCFHLFFCLRLVPELRKGLSIQRRLIASLLKIGGWMMVSNIIGPMLVYLDRFLIGAVATMTAVTYYTTPYDVVTRTMVVPTALVGVLFPAFSTVLTQDRARSARLYGRGLNFIFLAMFPLALVIVALAREGLTLWLDPDFAAHSYVVLMWLAGGVFFNSLARMPFILIQGSGRPEITAKVHMIELPCYVLLLLWLLDSYGIEGAACAWTIRVFVDMVLFSFIAGRLLPECRPVIRRHTVHLVAACALLVVAALITAGWLKAVYLAVGLIGFTVWGWRYLIGNEERKMVKQFMQMSRG